MADQTTISIGMDPAAVLAALKSISDQTKNLSKDIEDQLGKKATASINDLQTKAETGANSISKTFSNMATRLKEDLGRAFDLQAVIGGANFFKSVGQGVGQVLDMEKAFDRLNVRLGLSAKAMADFKAAAGKAVAATGSNIQDVQPGLLAAASRGNVRDPGQLTQIAEALGQARATSPDLNTGTITEDIAEILKRQGLQMNGQNFRSTLDAISGATAHGGFRDTADAAAQITQISPYAQQLGLNTRDMAGLAAVASKAGDSGESVLRQLLQQGTGVDQGARLNALFGANVFKNGKLDTAQLANVNTNQFGNISPQILEQTTGISGASGADLKLFIETFRQNMGELKEVTTGSDETAKQFGVATNNLASQIDMFKSRLKNAGQAIGDSLVEMASGLYHGDASHNGLSHLGSAVWENKRDLAAGGALTLGAGLLMGGGIRGLIGGAAADAAGVSKVYVTNAAEIAGEGLLSKAGGAIANGAGWLGRSAMFLGTAGLGEIAGLGAGAVGLAGAGVAAAGAAGYGIGTGVNYLTGNEGGLGGKVYDAFHPDEIKAAVVQGVVDGHKAAAAMKPGTNPSQMGPRQ